MSRAQCSSVTLVLCLGGHPQEGLHFAPNTSRIEGCAGVITLQRTNELSFLRAAPCKKKATIIERIPAGFTVTMEPLDLSSFFPPELWFQQFVPLDGLHSGVPTRTTPTLTPTTLRNIEQTFIELQSEVESHQNEAGFVPPVVQPITQGSTYMSLVDNKGWQGGITSVAHSSSRPTVSSAVSTISTATTTTRRNTGGRRPTKNAGLSPEEEERRRIRRERNKMAAARCRKRRVDHTNALLMETEGLEQKKQGLQQEIQQLQMQKEELEFLLEAHKACCRLNGTADPPSPPDVKPLVFPVLTKDDTSRLQSESAETVAALRPPPAKRMLIGADATGGAKPPRPTSLPVATAFTPHHHHRQVQGTLKAAVAVSEVAGVPITTPSAGIPFNFDSLMEGGTGLTPVSGPLVPSCSTQQRNAGCLSVDLSSPDSVPPKLVSL